ncbi:MAG: DNA-directed RNA polymerase subunit P [Candidatus Aenigmarchaeota archaeon]|nr:DNA-directed RNA polymerase subunit P [Candidatus Aenigmarchaeota archaeon]
MYKCLQCKELIKDEDVKEKIRCPHCGYRVITKIPGKKIVRVESK